MSGFLGRLFGGRPAGEGREVVNLAGGMHAWARAGLPVVASGDRPGRVI